MIFRGGTRVYDDLNAVSCKTQNYPQTFKPPKNQPNHPQTSQVPDKPPTSQPKIASFFP